MSRAIKKQNDDCKQKNVMINIIIIIIYFFYLNIYLPYINSRTLKFKYTYFIFWALFTALIFIIIKLKKLLSLSLLLQEGFELGLSEPRFI